MSLYLESSAALALLLGESEGPRVRQAVDEHGPVLVSELTRLESARCLRRLLAVGGVSQVEFDSLWSRFESWATGWAGFTLGELAWQRAGQGFPVEPVRALDALHLAAALELRLDVPNLALAALDERVRQNAAALGFCVLP